MPQVIFKYPDVKVRNLTSGTCEDAEQTGHHRFTAFYDFLPNNTDTPIDYLFEVWADDAPTGLKTTVTVQGINT